MNVSPALDARFRDAAAAEGLLDVAYDFVDSPVGTLLVAASPQGLCKISYNPEPEREVELLARAIGTRVLRAARPVDQVRRQLDEYFERRRTEFDLAIDLRLSTADFSRRVLEELARVPYGEVTTYGALAARADRPKAARASRAGRRHSPSGFRSSRRRGGRGGRSGSGSSASRRRRRGRPSGGRPSPRARRRS